MNAKSPEQSNPEVLRALVTGVLAAFEHPTLKNNLNGAESDSSLCVAG
ncbi:Uncharacterised protein [Serratia odorifera]|uniref:Uncharacterized protein n=1 Tax=Serratia odorifera TaxID=618 RepID=A0A3S4DRA2_SEROD|nr:Uncharacterised protein [Serratia odorifera]